MQQNPAEAARKQQENTMFCVGSPTAYAKAVRAMTLKHYVPISVLVFALVVGAVHRLAVPIVPVALILLAGETLLGFQLEDHRVPRRLKEFFTVPKPHHQ
jgi:hypothetical protein